ncbi:MAG: M28 family peptidase [Planctomycetota bacterium]|nr:M28 family peptidase [Planctomycetota bacterium]
MKCPALASLCAALLLPALVSPLAAQAADEIREQDLRAHIGFLACSEMEGRASGEHGGHLSGRYVEATFRRLGLTPLPGQTELRLPFQVGDLTCYNVVGVLRGTDPRLSERYLAIGGHLDHAGIGGPGAMGGPGEVHNGADDNASGTAGVLELAEWYVAHPPKHSIIFISAEERGLLGSEHLVTQKIVPVDQIRAMFNFDMIGRSNGYLFIGGLGTATEFHDLLDPILAGTQDMRLELDDRGEAPSDNTSFYHGGIPSLFFFTHIHEDYHLPGDDAEKIDYAGEARILRLAREMIGVVDAAPSIQFKSAPGMGMPADFNEKMMAHFQNIQKLQRARGKLGLRVEEAAGGMVVTSVGEGSSAADAGLLVDDLVKKINGREIHTQRDLLRALGAAEKGSEVTLQIERAGGPLTLKAPLK